MFDPKNFLKLAESIYKNKQHDKNARFRTAISRSYYSAFLICRTKLQEMQGHPFSEDEKVHKQVYDTLKLYDPTLADILKILKEDRNKADYYLSEKFSEAHVEEKITDAKHIIEKIETENFHTQL